MYIYIYVLYIHVCVHIHTHAQTPSQLDNKQATEAAAAATHKFATFIKKIKLEQAHSEMLKRHLLASLHAPLTRVSISIDT